MLELALTLLGVAAGIATIASPWQRWDVRATLLLPAPGPLLMDCSNMVDPEPIMATLSLIVIAVWTGLHQQRFTIVRFAPLLAVSYWFPVRDGP